MYFAFSKLFVKSNFFSGRWYYSSWVV